MIDLTLEVRSGHTALAGPVAAKSSVSKSLPVHGGDSTLSILLIRVVGVRFPQLKTLEASCLFNVVLQVDQSSVLSCNVQHAPCRQQIHSLSTCPSWNPT